MNTQAITRNRDNDFFLPELCRGEALLGLVLTAELLVMVLVLAEPGISGLDWSRLALVSFFVQWVLLLTVALLCLLRPWFMRLSSLQASLLTCTLAVLVTLVCTAVSQYLQQFHLGLALRDAAGARLYLKNALISLIMAAIVVRILYLQSESRRRQQAELQARLQALQARIRPHFLFNSLNSIASLIEIDPARAEQALLDLSGLFRAVLSQDDGLSSWQQETSLARQYLSLEQHRLADRLQVAWHIDTIPEELPIPHLTLQPLLENAILHGIQPLASGGLLTISAYVHQGYFELKTENPLPEQPGPHQGTGTALNNIQLRLQALFGPRASLTTCRNNGVFVTKIQYPFNPAALENRPRHESTDRR